MTKKILEILVTQPKGAQGKWRYASRRATFFFSPERHLAEITTFG